MEKNIMALVTALIIFGVNVFVAHLLHVDAMPVLLGWLLYDPYEGMTFEQRVATRLHNKLCTGNHTDGCSWYYESWDQPGYAKEPYLLKARKVIEAYGSVEAKILEFLEVFERLFGS